MRFRPCIDIHNGQVKQIIGGTLADAGDTAGENFASDKDAAWYARLYRRNGLGGGHVIMLNGRSSPYYAKTRQQALLALGAAPGFLQVGGGIDCDNAPDFLRAGASHVIVTSYVFSKGRIHWDRLRRLCRSVGRERIVLDVSCRMIDGRYRIVTDRWQKVTRKELSFSLLEELSAYSGEFLVHGVDVEGKKSGYDAGLVRLLAGWRRAGGALPVTYAGGIESLRTLELFEKESDGALDVTIGSALDLFGGTIPYRILCSRFSKKIESPTL